MAATFKMMQCCDAEKCKISYRCEAGKLHTPDEQLDLPKKCFDRDPYVIGGASVYSVGVLVDKPHGWEIKVSIHTAGIIDNKTLFKAGPYRAARTWAMHKVGSTGKIESMTPVSKAHWFNAFGDKTRRM